MPQIPHFILVNTTALNVSCSPKAARRGRYRFLLFLFGPFFRIIPRVNLRQFGRLSPKPDGTCPNLSNRERSGEPVPRQRRPYKKRSVNWLV
jgi:hypothetical protein